MASKYLRGYHPPFFFNINGNLAGYTLNAFLDGLRETPVGLRISGVYMTQTTDGSVTSPVGVTTMQLAKMTTGGSITNIVTLSITQGGGSYARNSTTSIATEALRTLDPNTRLGVQLTSAQTLGMDLCVSVFFGQ